MNTLMNGEMKVQSIDMYSKIKEVHSAGVEQEEWFVVIHQLTKYES